MQVVRGLIGGISLFFGQELNFLFAAAMAALIGFRLTPLLPARWPGWYDYIFILLLAGIAAAIVLFNQRVGYALAGFLVGGYVLIEYYAPGVLTVPLLPFLMGGVLGAFILGVFTEWALIILSSLIGAYFLVDLFRVSYFAKILIGSGLFIIGALMQANLKRSQSNVEEI
jgi:hypothetical protein